MNTKSPSLTLLFVLLFILFISRPGEKKQRETLVKHLTLRYPDKEEKFEKRMLQELRYIDGFFFSWTELNGKIVTHGVLGRVTILDGDTQRVIFYQPKEFLAN